MTHSPPHGVHHFTLPISDMTEAEAFYVDLLGLELLERFDRETFLRYAPARAHEADAVSSPLHLALRVGALHLDLFLQKDHVGGPRPHPHLAMEVAPDALDPFHERLRDAGVPTDGPRRLGPPGQASVYFTDPFDNVLELVTMGYRGEVAMGAPEVRSLARPR